MIESFDVDMSSHLLRIPNKKQVCGHGESEVSWWVASILFTGDMVRSFKLNYVLLKVAGKM